MRKVSRHSLLAALLALTLAGVMTFAGAQAAPAPNLERKVEAAELMERCMERVRAYKEEAGLAVSEEDLHGTGLIGAPYTLVTTTLGSLEAKRTTADPNMAALAVQLLEEAGVEPGGRVGAAFSGSFPGLNLAVLAACQAMDVELIYICSAGASTYGANQPELTFPEMAHRLVEDGLLARDAAALSMGGDYDCGEEMDPDLRDDILARLRDLGPEVIWEADFQKNLTWRRDIYEADGPLDCFIGVGGSVTTLGLVEDQLDCGVTKPYAVRTVTSNSGLMEYYNHSGIPVIHLLNIKKLTADYALPFDPPRLPEIGSGALYQTTRYPWGWAAAGLAAALVLLAWGRKRFLLSLALLPLLAGCVPTQPSLSQPEGDPIPESVPPEREEYLLLEGTEWENAVCVLRGREEGPAVYVVAGLHGDETAGWTAAGRLKDGPLRAGTLYILSPANTYGAEHDRRTTRSDRDVNRNFPGDPRGGDAQRIAAAIYEDIQDKAPALVLDLHEAREHQGERDNLGNSVIAQSLDGVEDLVMNILLDSGDGILCDSPLDLFSSPPEGSLNRTVTLELGIPTLTVETAREEELERRVENHLELVDYILKFYAMR